jgi:hypothetical protein
LNGYELFAVKYCSRLSKPNEKNNSYNAASVPNCFIVCPGADPDKCVQVEQWEDSDV